jgi:hypothetical protein
MTRRSYSPEFRAVALAALAANAGNLKRTARQLGLPRKTLEGWASGRTPTPEALCRQARLLLADWYEQEARDCLAAITPEKIAAAGLPELMVCAGIAVDKMLLLGGPCGAAPEARAGAAAAPAPQPRRARCRRQAPAVAAQGPPPVPIAG